MAGDDRVGHPRRLEPCSRHELLTRDAASRLWLYPGDNAGGFGTPVAIGSGWTLMDDIG